MYQIIYKGQHLSVSGEYDGDSFEITEIIWNKKNVTDVFLEFTDTSKIEEEVILKYFPYGSNN